MLNILFPRLCSGCYKELIKNEVVLCIECIDNLPIICHHRTNNLSMKQLFYGRLPLENATAMIEFQKKGITQELMHNLKYRGQKGVSSFFGKWLGSELLKNERFKSIDMVIPVPLHKHKLKKRGYNQVSGFGKEIAKALKIPFKKDVLLKVTKTKSQVFKRRFTRFSSQKVFTVKNAHYLKDKHVLLVDDIITTGATLESCAQQLLKSKNTRVSIATIAITN